MSLPPLLIATLLYMAAGAFREFIVVCYYRKVTDRKPLSASGLAGGIEFFDLVVLAAIFRSGFHPALLAGYTAGVIIGTYIGARWSK
jgi:hypothetical protein